MNKKIFNYFLSIFKEKYFIILFLIPAILSGLFIGLNSYYANYKKALEKDYKSYNYMDIKITSSIGFDKNIKDNLLKLDNIKGINLNKVANVLVNKNKKINVISISANRNLKSNNYINRLKLLKGKYPSTINEGLIENSASNKYNIKETDVITLIDKNDKLKAKKIKIVGIVKSSNYTTENNIYLNENNFYDSNYNEINIKISDTYTLFNEKYKNKVNNKINTIKNTIVKNLNNLRKEEIKKINEEINDNKENINNLSDLLSLESSEELIKEYNNNILTLEMEKSDLKKDHIKVSSVENLKRYKKSINNLEKSKNILFTISIIFFILILILLLPANKKIFNIKKEEFKTLLMLGYNKKEIIKCYIKLISIIFIILNIIGGLFVSKIVLYFIYLFSVENFSISLLTFNVNSFYLLLSIIISTLTNCIISKRYFEKTK